MAKSAMIWRARSYLIWKRPGGEAASVIREMLGEWLLHGGGLDPRQIEIADSGGVVLATICAADVLFRDGEFRSYSDDVTKSAPTGLARSMARKDVAE